MPPTISCRASATFQPEAYNAVTAELACEGVPLDPSDEQLAKIQDSWKAVFKIAGETVAEFGAEILSDWRDVKHEHDFQQELAKIETSEKIAEMKEEKKK